MSHQNYTDRDVIPRNICLLQAYQKHLLKRHNLLPFVQKRVMGLTCKKKFFLIESKYQ